MIAFFQSRWTMAVTALGLLLFSTSQSFSAQVPVRVVDSEGNGINNAIVWAIRFGQEGPDGTESKKGVTDPDGYAYLDLTSGLDFEIFAEKAGRGPTIRSQMFNPEHTHVVPQPVNNSTQTVRLKDVLSDKATININIENATPNSILFGNVRKISSGVDVAFGACVTAGDGTCTMSFLNVPPLQASEGKSYDVSAFDPEANGGQGRGNGMQMSVDVSANQTINLPDPLDMDGGLPPDLSANEGGSRSNNPGGNFDGNATVEGVVVDIDYSSMTVPHSSIMFLVDSNGQKQDRFGTWVDQNGRFKIFGPLEVGTTYYVRSFGGCRFDNVCYEGYESSTTFPVTNRGDFVYDSSTSVKVITVRLERAAPGNTNLAVYARDGVNNRSLPGSHVNIWPDNTQWHTDDGQPLCTMGFDPYKKSQPGFVNKNLEATTGYALITGLRPGNYSVRVFSQFGNNQASEFGGGADGVWNWGPQGGGSFVRGCFPGSYDDLRLTVEDNGQINVYNTSGTAIMNNISSITINVAVEATGSGELSGTLTFPGVVDLSANPITIMARGRCGMGGCQGNYATINGSGASSYDYEIQLSTFQSRDGGGTEPASYWIEIVSGYWGRVQENNDRDNIMFQTGGPTTITKNMKFAPAGRLVGKLYKPDGSLFQPSNSENGYVGASVNVNGITGHTWGHSQVLQDGSFVVGGLTPGVYEVRAEVHSNGNSQSSYANQDPTPRVTISANADAYKDVKFIDGKTLQITISTHSLPPLQNVVEPGENWIQGEKWGGYRVKSGFSFTPDNLGKLMTHGQESLLVNFVNPYQGGGQCGENWTGGFCPQRVPDDSTYDIYVTREGSIDGGVSYQYFTIVKTIKNVVVDDNHAVSDVVTVNGQPSGLTTGAKVTGKIVAENLFREVDFKALGGEFDNFIKYIPIIAIYDTNGLFKAAGLVTPPPGEIDGDAGDSIDAAILSNNFAAFKAAVDGLDWKFEIRGLSPSRSYTLVGTTPNYPPFSQNITVGADGSILDIGTVNWDDLGAGGTLTGLVRSTSSVAIENAQVEIGVKGAKSKLITTDADGRYTAEGLPKGKYRIKVSADGYAPSTVEREITDNISYTNNINLTVAPGSISGTVRELVFTSRGPVIKPVSGATIMAYDDTFNSENETEPLSLYKTETSSTGAYVLYNTVASHIYKIFALSPGRYISTVSTMATNGDVVDIDLDLKQKPLQIEVFAKRNDPYYEFSILNPNNFEDGSVYFENSAGGFDLATSSDISGNFAPLPDGSLLGKVLLDDLDQETVYILRIVAYPANGEDAVIKELEFGVNVDGNTDQPVDDKLIGDDSVNESGRKNNEVALDSSGGGTSIELPTGSLIQTSTADIPTITLAATDSDALSDDQQEAFEGEFAGDAYTINFSSVQFTGRDIVLNFGYDASAAGDDIGDLNLYHYVPGTGEWELVEGQVTIDPVSGVVSVATDPNDLTGFASESQTQLPIRNRPLQASASAAAKNTSMKALNTGQDFRVNAQAGSSGSGTFVVGLAVSTGPVNTSGNFKQYAFPNPFNLKDKTVTKRSGSESTRGTLITVAPTGSGSCQIDIKIYNVAGDMVREINVPGSVAGQYNYISWDGRNTAGEDVASGVYFAVVDAPGAPKRQPIKLVVVK